MPRPKQNIDVNTVADGQRECQISIPSIESNGNQPASTSGTPHHVNQTVSEVQHENDPKVPPIFLHRPVEFKKHVHKLLLSDVKFYQPLKGRNYIKVKCLTFEDHMLMTQFLKTKQLPYHTYGNPEHRKIKVVIRGLAKDTNLNTLKEEIESLNIPVVRLHKMHTKQTAKEHPLLVLVIVPNEVGEKLMQVNTLQNRTVKMEHPVAKPRQCHRCQKWGHNQRYCHGQIRCVKCAGEHLSSQCMRHDKTQPPKCANCAGDHTASYKKCSHCPDSDIYKLTQEIKLNSIRIKTKPLLITLSNYQTKLYKNAIVFSSSGPEPSDDECENVSEMD